MQFFQEKPNLVHTCERHVSIALRSQKHHDADTTRGDYRVTHPKTKFSLLITSDQRDGQFLGLHKPIVDGLPILFWHLQLQVELLHDFWYEFRHLQHRDVPAEAGSGACAKLGDAVS